MRYVAIAIACLAWAGPVLAQERDLASLLSPYVTAVDTGQLDPAEEARVRRVLAADLSHADRVIHLHGILDAAGALVHVDMHGGPLDDDTLLAGELSAPRG